jgi:hypothetical protein
MRDKRKEPRIEVNWPIRAFVGNRSIEGKAKNINLQGICIECKDPLHLEEKISISIFPPNCKPINVVGKAVWSDFYALDMDKDNVPLCIGVSFVELSVENQYLLKEIMEMSN